ncbi:MAG: hypothetical protein ACXWDO_08075 [Bacteroidia bacterium]
MKKIGQNEELLDVLAFEESLLDGTLTGISFNYNEYSFTIEIDVKLISSKIYRKVRLVFSQVKEFCFFDDSASYVIAATIYIANLKFFKFEDGFYISIDPFEEVDYPQKDDNFYILSKELVGYDISEQ